MQYKSVSCALMSFDTYSTYYEGMGHKLREQKLKSIPKNKRYAIPSLLKLHNVDFPIACNNPVP